jgi:hypothetical protein
LGPIIIIIDKIGALQSEGDADPHDRWRLGALETVERIVLAYLPSDGPKPADTLKSIEQIILADRINEAAALA